MSDSNTARPGPAPIPVTDRFYLTECERCGWRGSSEQTRLIDYGDDADLECPSCERIFAAKEIKNNG